MTLSLFFVSLFLNLGMATQIMAGEMFEFRWSRIKTFVAMIVSTTFIIELLATIYLYFPFREMFSPKTALFYAFFHAVSAFCNAGLSPLEGGLQPFANNTPFMLVIALLVFIGSIGFVVWLEVGNKIKRFFLKAKHQSFSLHTKIVLMTTGIILAAGTTLTWLLEQNNSLKDVSLFKALFISFFNTISLRSAGFELFDIATLMPATILLFLILMYIGGSPGSMSGGIKTTTLALFVTTMATIVRNRDEVELFGRRIPKDQIYRAISIIVLSVGWIFLATFALLVVEHDFNFIQVFFEVVSALSLCGLPTKISTSFSFFGKVVIIITMLLGRVGSLTLVFAFWARKKKHLYHYPEERVVIG